MRLQRSPRFVLSQALGSKAVNQMNVLFFCFGVPATAVHVATRQADRKKRKKRCSVSIILNKHVLLFAPESKSRGRREQEAGGAGVSERFCF